MNLTGWLVETAHPRKIMLFGVYSTRREMGLNSDFDILVVVPSVVHRRNTA